MATSGDSPMMFYQTCGNSFYFQDTTCASSSGSSETELCSDEFKKHGSPKSHWIQSTDQKFLVLKTRETFKFEDRTNYERGQPDCKFKIQIYQDSVPNDGQSVMLYIYDDNQKMMISCQDNKEVIPEEMDPCSLEKINGTGHKALFRWKRISTDKYKFESTVHAGYFLAFEPVEEAPCLYKLILRRPLDEVDEPLMLGVTECKP
ncbi:interleukin-18-like isoform 1-T2 [Anableps anableps]